MSEENTPKALVIGGCRGIGRAVSLRLAKDGFDVCATSRSVNSDTRSLEQEINSLGRKFTLLVFDVCDREAARKTLADAFGDSAPDCVV